ncbi:Pectate lyase superfamily protein [compost metagenome]
MTTANFPPELGGDGVTIDDTDSPTTGLGNGGHRLRFMLAMQQFLKVAQWCLNALTAVIGYKNEAATSASNAATSAGAAEAAQLAAEAAAEAAGDAQGTINSRYYGARVTDPTVRPDGSPMQAGDRYFNTVTSREMLYTGTVWANPNIGATDLVNSTDAAKGDALIAQKRQLVSSVATTLHYWHEAQPVNVQAEFGAVLDGVADDTLAYQRALATGRKVYHPKGTANITDTLSFAAEGQVLFGDGKDGQSVISNTTNNKPLFTFSAGTGAVYRRRCGIEQVSFVGNAATTEGVALRGILDDGLTGDADKSCWMREVRIRDVGAGFGLRVSSWSNTFNTVEIWSCNKGLKCGSEFNANSFNGLYISGCTNEGIQSPVGPGVPASNVFINTVVQYCGGTNASIDIQEGYNYNFLGVYLEGNTSPCNLLLAAGSQGCTVTGVMHNLTTGLVGIQVVRSEGKSNRVEGVINLGGTVHSLVYITGTLPTTVVGSLFVAVGTATNGELYDISTRKATVRLDGLESRVGPTVIRSLFNENALEIRRSDTDALQAFWQDGKLYFGPDTTVPVLSRAGGTLSMTYSAGTGTFRAPQFGLGTTGDPIWMKTPGSPEGAITAPPGSLCSRTAGGANTTLYVKESGTGNTGWVAK